MPRVHYFVPMSDIRARVRDLVRTGLHAGIDIRGSDPLFGAGWDREARDLGRLLQDAGLEVVLRGPGRDLPLTAGDPYVAGQVRVCHERALAAAMHLGCRYYVVRLPPVHGLSRSERLAGVEASGRMLGHLAGMARARGLRLVLQHELEDEACVLELALDHLRAHGGGLLFSGARALWAGFDDPEGFLDRHRSVLVGLDLTDLHPGDLEPRLPGRGVLGRAPWLAGLLTRDGLGFCVVHLPAVPVDEVVQSLNDLAGAPAAHDPRERRLPTGNPGPPPPSGAASLTAPRGTRGTRRG